jgi:signal peptidase I
VSRGVGGLIDRFLPIPPVGLGPSLNLLPSRSPSKPSSKPSAWQPTLNLATPQPTVDLVALESPVGFTSTQPSSFFLAPAPSAKPSRTEASAYFLPRTPRTVHRRRVPHLVRWVVVATLWTVLGAGAGLLLTLGAPIPFGYHSFVVMSGSMEPAIRTGDVVIDKKTAPGLSKVGDIVTYRDPYFHNHLVTHRVRAVSVSGGKASFVTKGDANNNGQRWSVSTSGSIGVVKFRIPKLGYALVWINSRLGRVTLIIVPLVLLCAYEIVSIWRKEPKGKANRNVVWA